MFKALLIIVVVAAHLVTSGNGYQEGNDNEKTKQDDQVSCRTPSPLIDMCGVVVQESFQKVLSMDSSQSINIHDLVQLFSAPKFAASILQQLDTVISHWTTQHASKTPQESTLDTSTNGQVKMLQLIKAHLLTSINVHHVQQLPERSNKDIDDSSGEASGESSGEVEGSGDSSGDLEKEIDGLEATSSLVVDLGVPQKGARSQEVTEGSGDADQNVEVQKSAPSNGDIGVQGQRDGGDSGDQRSAKGSISTINPSTDYQSILKGIYNNNSSAFGEVLEEESSGDIPVFAATDKDIKHSPLGSSDGGYIKAKGTDKSSMLSSSGFGTDHQKVSGEKDVGVLPAAEPAERKERAEPDISAKKSLVSDNSLPLDHKSEPEDEELMAVGNLEKKKSDISKRFK